VIGLIATLLAGWLILDFTFTWLWRRLRREAHSNRQRRIIQSRRWHEPR
jgi:hypothetical protein